MTYSLARPKSADYFWVTWLTKLLAGENACKWAIWFKAHNKFDKLDTGFELEKWTKEHNELVLHRMRQLEGEGFKVFIEDMNSFQARGKSGIIVAGKPDIVAVRDDLVVFEDCKTGKRRKSDHYQVLLYLLLAKLPQIPAAAKKHARIVYKDEVIDADSDLGFGLGDQLRDLVLMLSADDPPEARPSAAECRYCDIPDFYCEDRINDPGNSIYVTDAF